MPEYTLRIRRFNPETGAAPYWDRYTVDLEPHRSVLEAILTVKNAHDGSLGVRCSCKAAICGSCGMTINGKAGLACNTHLSEAMARSKDGTIEVQPLGNMPVIKDLIVDMGRRPLKKVNRVTPWLLSGDLPEREHIVPRESMVDVTQPMACIQCGSCVGDCLAMEVDPEFIGPAALAKAYRFVGDPRERAAEAAPRRSRQRSARPVHLHALLQVHRGLPEGRRPMNQIMRLRRIAGNDHHIEDQNNGERHEQAFVVLLERYGLLDEFAVVPRSYGGNGITAGKFSPKTAEQGLSLARLPRQGDPARQGEGEQRDPPAPPGAVALAEVKQIYKDVKAREERLELNLYITGYDEDGEPATEIADKEGATA